jgi:uncharacterized protein YndB with AHSA1/START domain
MAALKRLQWSVDIAAPASSVYQILVAPESYTKWTSAFGESLYFKGSWQEGRTIRFMTPGGDGVVSEFRGSHVQLFHPALGPAAHVER